MRREATTVLSTSSMRSTHAVKINNINCAEEHHEQTQKLSVPVQ